MRVYLWGIFVEFFLKQNEKINKILPQGNFQLISFQVLSIQFVMEFFCEFVLGFAPLILS